MKSKHNIFHGQFVLSGDKLVPRGKDAVLFESFKKSLSQSQIVDIFMEAGEDDGTIAQLAKIHACIREMAKETGYTFEDMKLEIKIHSGLCIKKQYNGEDFMYCKSFADCSKEDLAAVINTIIEIGDGLNINFR